jgi:hypothetical protein
LQALLPLLDLKQKLRPRLHCRVQTDIEAP